MTNATAIAAAWLVAATIGCERTADPVGPSGSIHFAKGGTPGAPGGGSGGGDESAAYVVAAGAISTAGAEYPVIYFKDNRRTLELGSNVVSALDFMATHQAGLAGCVTDEPTTGAHQQALLDLLVDPAQDRVMWMTVDRTALGRSSASHGVSQPQWNEEPGTLYSLGVGGSDLLPSAGSPTVSEQILDSRTATYTFQGGALDIKDRSERSSVHLVCPNLDVVTVTVRRP